MTPHPPPKENENIRIPIISQDEEDKKITKETSNEEGT